ncbi:CHS1 [Acrasis kona]|uniref:CHS1 n=1 Tax=Acrasis kona TaxID=1008807 RepID=A0AAW2YVG6_9EUKA
MYAVSEQVDLCNNFVWSGNFTCENFFCTDPYQILQDNPEITYNFYLTFSHYCKYCNYVTRPIFQTLLDSGSCPYHFMSQHTTPKQCWDGDAVAPTFIHRSHFFDNLDHGNATLLMLNNTFHAKLSPNDYYCHCPSVNLFGMECNSITRFWIPFRYTVVPFIMFALRILMLVLVLLAVLVPRLYDIMVTKVAQQTSVLKNGFKIFRKLSFYVIFFMCASLVFSCVDDFNTISLPKSLFYFMSNNFKLMGWFCAFMSYGTLLVIWANVYQRTSAHSARNKVTRRLKILLVFIYAVQISVCLGCVITLFVLQARGTMENVSTVWYVIDLFGFTSTFLLSICFTIYSVRMYQVLLKVNTQASLKKVRFAHFMIVTVPLLWLVGLWMVLFILTTKKIIYSAWLSMYLTYIIDLSFLLLFLLMTYVLFDDKMFVQCCTRPGTRIINKSRFIFGQEERSESLLESRNGGDGNDDDTCSSAISMRSSVNPYN